MPSCPRCHQEIARQAIACPHCHILLKAHGHPGITIHRADGNGYLCPSCTYQADDTCTYPQRPYAQECTLYRDCSQPSVSLRSRPRRSLSTWLQQNVGWIGLVVLVGVSVAIAVRR